MDFKILKARIEIYSRSSQISICIQLLDKLQREESKTYPVWNILVLIKWILLYADNSESRLVASFISIDGILKDINEFEKDTSLLNFKSQTEVKRSLRILAYQQFWLQDYVSNKEFSRQIQLYKLLKHKHDIDEEFKNLTSLSILEFLDIAYSIFLYFNLNISNKDIPYDGFLHSDYFEWAFSKLGKDKVKTFIRHLSVIEKSHVVELQKMAKEEYQLYETNFFTTKPFFVINEKIKTPYKAVFNQTCKYYIYDFLKKRSARFPEELGARLEKYIELGLKEIGLSFLKESQLKKTYSRDFKLADFVVSENVIIECKAIELSPQAAVIRNSELLSITLKGSIIKSYCQLLSTANALNTKMVFYGLVVTYKEMYIGSGIDAWEEFLKEDIEAYVLTTNIPLALLPPENLYFIDLETWDLLIQSMKVHKCSIIDIIEKGKELNGDVQTKKMLLDQIIKSKYPIQKYDLSYLEEGIKYISCRS